MTNISYVGASQKLFRDGVLLCSLGEADLKLMILLSQSPRAEIIVCIATLTFRVPFDCVVDLTDPRAGGERERRKKTQTLACFYDQFHFN